MPSFRFVAVTAQNERRSGTIAGPTVEAVARELLAQGLTVLKIAPQGIGGMAWDFLNADISARTELTSRDLGALSIEWGSLVEAGVPLADALSLSASGARTSYLRDTIHAVLLEVREGRSLNGALQHTGGRFPPAFIALVKAGEETASLGPSLTRLGRDIEARRQFREELRNALLYPAFIMVTACGAILLLLTVVVPSIETLLVEGGAKRVPAMTRLVIALSHLLRDHGVAGLVGAGILAISIALLSRRSGSRPKLHGMLLMLPMVGALILRIQTARLLRALAELLAGGIGLSRALPLAIGTVSNLAMRGRLAGAQSRVLQGASLADAFAQADCLSADVIQVVRVGERTGKLPGLCAQAAVVLEARSRSQLKALTTMLGPSLTIVFGAIAGVIIYAVMTTILSLNEFAFQ